MTDQKKEVGEKTQEVVIKFKRGSGVSVLTKVGPLKFAIVPSEPVKSLNKWQRVNIGDLTCPTGFRMAVYAIHKVEFRGSASSQRTEDICDSVIIESGKTKQVYLDIWHFHQYSFDRSDHDLVDRIGVIALFPEFNVTVIETE